jgi:hypothetical protein
VLSLLEQLLPPFCGVVLVTIELPTEIIAFLCIFKKMLVIVILAVHHTKITVDR